MSSIHYKFRATLEYKTLQFDGLHIRGEDLVREICTKENIKIELFNLLLQNAHTKKNYADEELIPRNSSILVQRVPRTEVKVQKVQSGVNSGMINQGESSASGADGGSHISSTEFEKMDEADRLNHVKDVSTRAYDPSNFRKKTGGIMSGPPPPTYTCNRCYQPGHWYKNCPMLNTKRTTGIPSQELMETTANDPLAMLHPSGKYVVPIMHWNARQNQVRKTEGSGSPVQDRKVPPELQCPICHNLTKEAVVTSCCGNSYCADCIGNFIVESESKKCPGADCNNEEVTVDSLIPNKRLREAAEAWLNQKAGGSTPSGQESQGQDPIRIRIGLQPKPISSTPSFGVISPGTTQFVDRTTVESAPGVTSSPAGLESVAVPVAAPVPLPESTAAVPVSQFAVATQPAVSQAFNIPLDTSLPPPTFMQTVMTSEPMVPGIPSISTYLQPVGIPGISMIPQQPQNQQMMPGYMVGNSSMGMYSGPTSAYPATATSSRDYDAWDSFLKNKGVRDDRRVNTRRDVRRRSPHGRDHRDYDKERERERIRRKERETRGRRRRSSSSSSESSDSTSSSSSDDERRHRKREKTREELKRSEKDRVKREQERDRRDREKRDRERERERRDREKAREREGRSSRSKNMKVRDSRREKESDDSSRRRRKESRKAEEVIDEIVEKVQKEVKEDDDEAAIDGALAEYEKLRESTSDMNVKDDDVPTDSKDNEDSGKDSEHEKTEGGEEEEDTAEEEPNYESGTDASEIADNRSERDSSAPAEENVTHALATETSEAEVTESKSSVLSPTDGTAPVTEESDEKEAVNENSDDEEKKEKKRDKKHKKHKKKEKKHKRHEDEDDGEEKRRKKHKKHKKEKKAKKQKKESHDDNDHSDHDDDKEKKKHHKKDRKREREADDSDSDEPKSKNRRHSEDHYSAGRSSQEKERVEESARDKDRKRDRERDSGRDREVEKRRDEKERNHDIEKRKPKENDSIEKMDVTPPLASNRKPISFVVNKTALKASSSLKISPKPKKSEEVEVKKEQSSRERKESERPSEVKSKKTLSERMERRRKEETDVESGNDRKRSERSSRSSYQSSSSRSRRNY